MRAKRRKLNSGIYSHRLLNSDGIIRDGVVCRVLLFYKPNREISQSVLEIPSHLIKVFWRFGTAKEFRERRDVTKVKANFQFHRFYNACSTEPEIDVCPTVHMTGEFILLWT